MLIRRTATVFVRRIATAAEIMSIATAVVTAIVHRTAMAAVTAVVRRTATAAVRRTVMAAVRSRTDARRSRVATEVVKTEAVSKAPAPISRGRTATSGATTTARISRARVCRGVTTASATRTRKHRSSAIHRSRLRSTPTPAARTSRSLPARVGSSIPARPRSTSKNTTSGSKISCPTKTRTRAARSRS